MFSSLFYVLGLYLPVLVKTEMLTMLLDQVYSNTRAPTQVNTSQHESTQVNMNQHESDTSSHEPDTSQHESTRVQHESTRVNTSQHESVRP